MASRISQMRNEVLQQPTQQPLNNSIEQIRYLMNTIQSSGNPQAMMNNLFGKNPQLAALAKQPNLKTIAEQMAREKGIDLNQLIQQLQS